MRLLSRMMSAALVVAALVSGCSSSSNNNDGSMAYTPPPATTKLTDLTPADLNQLCVHEASSLSSGVSCADGGANSLNVGVCSSTAIQPDCTATVGTSQTCMAKLTADVCNYQAYTADLVTPECMVMLACTQSLCTNAFCFCSNNNALGNCQATCRSYTKGLTTACATCLSGLFATTLTCTDFTMLPAPYDQCSATCP